MKVPIMPLFLEGTGLHKRNQIEARRITRKTQDTAQSLGPTCFWSRVARVMWSPTTTFFHDSVMRGECRELTNFTNPHFGVCVYVHLCMNVEEGGEVGGVILLKPFMNLQWNFLHTLISWTSLPYPQPHLPPSHLLLPEANALDDYITVAPTRILYIRLHT